MEFDLATMQMQGSTGMDAMFKRDPGMITPNSRHRVASLQDLKGFIRLGADTLIHKSNRDLWAIRKDGEEVVIERLFDDNGEPIKG